MSFDIVSDFNILGGLPKGSARIALDSSIADEGAKVIKGDEIILSNGDHVAWTPPPEKIVMPDLSGIKSLRQYFGQRGYRVYPAWLYHPTLPPLLVKDAKEAAGRGIVHRQTTPDERNRYGLKDVWDWEDGCDWRPQPYEAAKFDPKNPGAGKTVIHTPPDPKIAQHELVAALIPAVVSAVVQSLKATGPAAPASVDASQWDAFLQFQAWQKTQEVVAGAAAAIERDVEFGETATDPDANDPLVNALSPEQDRLLWEEEAKRVGVKVDGRWSTERLKAAVEKAGSGTA